MKIDVLGIQFDNLTLDEMVEAGAECLRQGGFHYAVTPNPEFLLSAQKDPEFAAVLNGADLVMPDGVGVLYAARILGTPLKERTPGVDFAARLAAWCAQQGKTLFLLGAKPGIAEQAAENLRRDYPGLVVCGTHDGYFQEDAPVAAAIRAAGADLVFVCLGAPRQEKWMAQWGRETGAALMVGLGGALDVFAGAAKRAPEGWQKLGLEWLYRLVREPQRLGRMARLPLVLIQAAGVRLRGKRTHKEDN